ncbi:MAG: Maf family protein [Proteobacteria bacterium]|nr:Maf family protein [Pseudomonadota bacterium]
MSSTQLILASASPRRQQLLTQLGVAHQVSAQNIDETRIAGEAPVDFVCRMAMEKARAALLQLDAADETVILASDTVVVCAGEVLGKPLDRGDAVSMLLKLSDKVHQVLSAITVLNKHRESSACSMTRVQFREIQAEEADQYWQTGEPAGKAGAYAIQGFGAAFVKTIDGSYSGVMGLPLFETAQLLSEFGIPCWQIATETDA